MKRFKIFLLMFVVAVIGAAAFIGLGVYNVAADDPHWPLTHRLMETVRSRSISTRAVDVTVPPLDDDALIRAGAGNYDAMCVTCHLSPGTPDTELSLGLYPPPPTWSELGAVDPREAFWVIKHGVKMSGMPAWGKSMDDRYIWGMVALLRQFPRMTQARYHELVTTSGGHDHGGGESMPHDAATLSGMDQVDPPADGATRSSFEPIDDPMAEAASDADHHRH
ncbi:MAG: cytochrome c [Xanthomonadales bacterium]|nr:cytochrome c [Xanthomonadales bacterium]MBK7145381.1 cytochrome c [Xanthomonadales bacterium]MCC6561876.1 cytochrome c [Xanthomonadales bacterium]